MCSDKMGELADNAFGWDSREVALCRKEVWFVRVDMNLTLYLLSRVYAFFLVLSYPPLSLYLYLYLYVQLFPFNSAVSLVLPLVQRETGRGSDCVLLLNSSSSRYIPSCGLSKEHLMLRICNKYDMLRINCLSGASCLLSALASPCLHSANETGVMYF